DKRMDTIPEKLMRHQVQLCQHIVYTTHETAQQVTQNFDGILFFSPSAVKSFFSVNQLAADTHCFAVGNTTAKTLEPYTGHITVAAQANGAAMLDKVMEQFV